MLYWGIEKAEKNLTNNLEFDSDGFIVVRDEKRVTEPNREAVAILVLPQLFRMYQEIARWYLLKEAGENRDFRLKAMELAPALERESHWTGPLYRFHTSAIAQQLFAFVEEEKEKTQLPELSDEDYVQFERSMSEVLEMRQGPGWTRPVPDLEP